MSFFAEFIFSTKVFKPNPPSPDKDDKAPKSLKIFSFSLSIIVPSKIIFNIELDCNSILSSLFSKTELKLDLITPIIINIAKTVAINKPMIEPKKAPKNCFIIFVF